MHNQPVVPDPAASAFRVPIVFKPLKPNMTDEEVMEQLRNGNPDALPILFDRFHRLVLKIALRILRDAGEAEDVMQDIFFEILRKADQFDPAKGSTKTWILQYAYHRSLSRRQYLALRNFYDRHQTTELDVVESNRVDASWRGLTFHEWRRVIHIADVYDVDSKGKDQRAFGRVFYTERKSTLIFYAFDLNDRNTARRNASFQVWGKRGPAQGPTHSLGLFQIDDQQQNRWVLRFEDPQVLAQIDSVFVTVEPAGGSAKPTGRQFLYAYLNANPSR